MNQTHNPELTKFAQRLRRDMTQEERHLWYDFLKPLSLPVKRQKVIGPYIVDFYCASAKLVIELDGSQHYEDAHQARDRTRDDYLQGLGLAVLRFSNLDVNQNFEGVCQEILKYIDVPAGRKPSP
jgi:very-short-patch-repair endonuclease